MPARDAFEYAVVRVVPQVEREEFVNAGIILFCRARDYLAARISSTPRRCGPSRPTPMWRSSNSISRAFPRSASGDRSPAPWRNARPRALALARRAAQHHFASSAPSRGALR